MTSAGVDGTAADCQPRAALRDRALRPHLIKRDDERLAPRYIELAYPHTPAGAAPNSLRCERQVASALRNTTDFMIVSLIRGAAGTAGRASADPRVRLPPPGRPAGGPR